MKWTVHGERLLYESEWMNLAMVDVEIPGDHRFEHHVLRYPRPAVGTIVHDDARGVLLLYRHRFITDSWGYEIPAGGVDDGETLAAAAVRETVEEAGWEPHDLVHLAHWHPSNGSSDQTFHAFLAPAATYVGAPTDPGESERIEWVPVDELRAIIRRGEMPDGLSLTAVAYAFATGAL